MLIGALRRGLRDLAVGFWFIALIAALLGPVLAVIVVAIDRSVGAAGVFQSLVISPTSARTILSSIAGSLITIASLTSSLTIVTLQLLSNQYTPRAIRGFLGTRLSQTVFGTFLGIFLYCLLLLVVVRAPGDENEPFVPSLGVVVSIVLATGSLVVLVIFIHRMSQLIQISTTASGFAAATLSVVQRVHPDSYGGDSSEPEVLAAPTSVRAAGNGTVVRIDESKLAALAGRQGVRVEVVVRPGDSVTTRSTVLQVEGDVTPTVRRELARGVQLGRERDLDQDPTFGVQLITDIALRALSPGINDPTTAVTCVHRLQPVLELVAASALPARRCIGSAPSLILRGPVLEDYLALISEIGRYGSSDIRVQTALSEALSAMAEVAAERGAHTRVELIRDLADELLQLARSQSITTLDEARLNVVSSRLRGR